MRYDQIQGIIAHNKPGVIVEVGTWNGLRAVMMATEALKHREKVHYVGFDLFETATDETDARELNVKAHCSVETVRYRLDALAARFPGFSYALHEGDTRETLDGNVPEKVDLAFIDGGHSIETIKNDYAHLKHAEIVLLDDFYEPDAEGKCPDLAKFGCNSILDGKDRMLLPMSDPIRGGGMVRMALIPPSAWPGKVNMVIQTKNCVADERIQANIKYATTLVKRWVPQCNPHSHVAVICSGGPSLKDHLDEIRARQEAGDYIICVKHAHDVLIEAGIVPWGCMLLDPRSHVQDFIENPHPDVRYFVASMCHPTTVDRLLDQEATVWGYNAHVGAGEDAVVPKELDGRPAFLIGGGSTSAVRGISVLYCAGFRRFVLYGFDSCYTEPQDTSLRTKTGMQKYFEVDINGRPFWTDPELLAQAQDFERLMQQDKDISLEVVGDGMISHIWSIRRKVMPEMTDVFGG